MCAVILRAFRIGLVMAALAAVPGTAGAEAPEGARLAIVKWDLKHQSLDLIDTDRLGSDTATLFAGTPQLLPAPYPYDGPSWSPSGDMVAFTAAVGIKRRRFSSEPRTKIFVVSADGSDIRPVPGTAGGAAPVIAPDGHTVAFRMERKRLRANHHGGGTVVYDSASIWIIDLDRTGKRRLTPWSNKLTRLRPHSRQGEAFSRPPGRLAIATAKPWRSDLSSGATTVLAHRALKPVYSPDGSEIAFLHGRERTARTREGRIDATFTDLYSMRADGSELRRLTRTSNAIELAPSWEPSGQRLAFTRFRNPFSGAITSASGRDHGGQRRWLVPDEGAFQSRSLLLRRQLATRSRSRGRTDRLLGETEIKPEASPPLLAERGARDRDRNRRPGRQNLHCRVANEGL